MRKKSPDDRLEVPFKRLVRALDDAGRDVLSYAEGPFCDDHQRAEISAAGRIIGAASVTLEPHEVHEAILVARGLGGFAREKVGELERAYADVCEVVGIYRIPAPPPPELPRRDLPIAFPDLVDVGYGLPTAEEIAELSDEREAGHA